MAFDELWRGGPRLKQSENSFRLSTDSILLGDFVRTKRGCRCLDLGSGAGVLSILLAAKCESASVVGIELQPDFAELSRENLHENSLEERVEIICGDLREHRTIFAAESFDLVVSNPPYFPKSSGFSAPEESRALAREEIDCTLEDICIAARWLLRWGGDLAMVHRPERLSEIFCAMTAVGIEPKRLRMVHYSPERPPNLVLIEGKRGAESGIVFAPPLILTVPDGSESDEVQRIYRRGKFSPDKET